MEGLKRIDEQLMTWITARPYGYKLERRKHARGILFTTITLSLFTLDILMYGGGIINTLAILLLGPSVFYEWRLWLRLRGEEEKQ
jgi:hypothetical protein